MGVNYEALIAAASIIADVGAFCGVYIAYRAFKSQEQAFRDSSESLRLSVSAELVEKLESKFDSEVIRGSRHSAARAILDHEDLRNAEDVFDFFEAVGLLSRLGALNDEMVYSTFFTGSICTGRQDRITSRRCESKEPQLCGRTLSRFT